MNNSIIVLGGEGFVGKNIIKSLIRQGFQDVTSGSLSPPSSKTIKKAQVNILDFDNLKNVCKPFDTIINCTGQITKTINNCFLLNSRGITNIAKLCKNNNKKIIQISSVAVYGTSKFVDENSELNPETPYATCKCYSEYILNNLVPNNNKIILRASNLYGIGTKGIFGYLYSSYYSDRKLQFNNDGSLSRYYLHVEDFSENIVQIIKKNLFGTFNIVGQEKYSIKELVSLLESSVNKSFNIKYEQAAPLENIDYISDEKIRKIIKIKNNHKVEDFFIKYFK